MWKGHKQQRKAGIIPQRNYEDRPKNKIRKGKNYIVRQVGDGGGINGQVMR